MFHSLSSSLARIRALIWPIYAHEHKKLVPMFVMLFLICINYTLLKNMKDALNVTASGAEVIPYIKLWVMFPSAVIATFAFTKLASHYSHEKVFYITISFFLGFYLLFIAVLYPLREHLHPYVMADYLEVTLPLGFKGIIALFRNWTFTCFYVFSELWSCMVLTVLFWGFANEVTKLEEAKRCYSFFNVASNFASIIAGIIPTACVYFVRANFTEARQDDASLTIQTVLVLICGVATMFTFRWLNVNVLNGPEFDEFHQTKLKMKKKKRLSIRESFALLSGSRYLICIAILVLGYNLGMNLLEVMWKNEMFLLYPSRSDFNSYIGKLTSINGMLAMMVTLFIPKLLDRFGWTRTALITPVVMCITGGLFFGLILYQQWLPVSLFTILGTTPLAVIVYLGAFQNTTCKAFKFCLFDTTKEMAFIPLDNDVKLKGKAAIDGVGSRLGKTGGSVAYQGLLMIFPTLTACAPYVATVFFFVICLWIYAVRALGVMFREKTGSALEPEDHDAENSQESSTLTASRDIHVDSPSPVPSSP
ncbi:MAG: NTP/NDP exchange transporter [Chlamydiia bacterium]|nr:NTP/NDP exchange transporter [Chlamydiia bacterium]